VKLEIRLIEARLRAPVVAAHSSVEVRPLILVKVTDAAGLTSYGEAAPLQSYDGVGVEDVRAALEDCRRVLAAADSGALSEDLLAECAQVAVLPQAVAAIDLALWDLAARRVRQPVWRLLGAAEAGAVDVNGTLAAADRAGAAVEAAALRAEGFRCVKAKVAIGDDAGRLAAVRAAAGPEVALRIDANGAWSVDEANAALRALAPVGIELCEEPVSGVDSIRQVADRTSVAIAIDETVRQPGALERRSCDAVCLKIAGCGGISGVLDAARRARTVGYEVYLASTFDGPLGIAAALHAAAVVRPDRPSGLATLPLFEAPVPFAALDGRLRPPDGPGLGDGLVEWYDHW
jgi:L-Ala-D/L-Glu epimerase